MPSFYRTFKAVALVAVCACAATAAACSDPVTPGADVVSGTYVANVLTADSSGFNFLANGSDVELRLDRDGTFRARMRVPTALALHDMPLEVVGRWSFSDALRLTGSPDTFLDDLSFAVQERNVLTGEGVVNGATIQMRLVPVRLASTRH